MTVETKLLAWKLVTTVSAYILITETKPLNPFQVLPNRRGFENKNLRTHANETRPVQRKMYKSACEFVLLPGISMLTRTNFLASNSPSKVQRKK